MNSGVLLRELVDAFGVSPQLTRSVQRQLHAWATGASAPREETKWKLVEAVVDTSLSVALCRPLDVSEVRSAAVRTLYGYLQWLDGLAPAEGQEQLAVAWLVEHSTQMWGYTLGIVRHAWAKPLREPAALPDWLPLAFDDENRSLTGEVVTATLDRAKAGRTERQLRELLEEMQVSDEGHEVKRATLKSWRSGMTLPKGRRMDEVEKAAQDWTVRFRLGVRGIVEKLAKWGTQRDMNRNAVGIWLAHAEVHAWRVQRAMHGASVRPEIAVSSLGTEWFFQTQSPVLTPASTFEDLPFNWWAKQFTFLKVTENGRSGYALVTVEPGESVTLNLSFKPRASRGG